MISDKCLGLVEALGEFFPEAQWQRCVVHWYRNVFTAVPKGKVKAVASNSPRFFFYVGVPGSEFTYCWKRCPLSRAIFRPVAGITCMSPRAPARLKAPASKLDS